MRRAPRRMRRQLQPDMIRLFYFSRLRALMAVAHSSVTEGLLPLLQELRADGVPACPVCDRGLTHTGSHCPRGRRPGHRWDVGESDWERLRAATQKLAREFAPSLTPNKLKPLAAQVAQRTSAFQKLQLQGQLTDAMGVSPFLRDEGLAAAADAFTTTNVALIRTVPERYFAEIEDVVTSAVEAGLRASEIAAQLEERYKVSESNAARIANDQVGKFFGELNDTRQRELGITQSVWSTVHDNRVRDAHEKLDGQTYTLGEGLVDEDTGETIIPGQAINCRCQGLPDLSELLGEE